MGGTLEYVDDLSVSGNTPNYLPLVYSLHVS